MTEEVVKVEVEAPVVETKEVEYNPTELQAMDQGWLPKDEWEAQGNDPNDHRSAKEFVERGEIYRSLSQTRGELKRIQMAHGALQKHHQHVFEKAHQTALNDLKLEKRQAIRNEDLETAEAIDEQIDELKETHAQEKQQIVEQQQAIQQTAVVSPEWDQWKGKNVWYDADETLREEADSIGHIFIMKRPGVQPTQVLEHVEKEIKRRYPDKFAGKRAAPNAVQGVDRTSRKGPQTPEIELDDVEREVMRQLVSSGEMTEKEYKAELKKAKGLK